ncbi:MAG: hypothetical protein JXR76_18915 [Deltaproteobacteria bacterium]|nr:hypothetical protein [Deltaproteobacteria bacterium]
MSRKKRKRTESVESTLSGGFTSAQRRSHGLPTSSTEDKLSKKIEVMAIQLLNDTEAFGIDAMRVAVRFAQISWNLANDDDAALESDLELKAVIDDSVAGPSRSVIQNEFKIKDPERAISQLVKYKKRHFSDDNRRILAAMVDADGYADSENAGRINVSWAYGGIEKLREGNTLSDCLAIARRAETGPLAKKIVREAGPFRKTDVVNLSTYKTDMSNSEALRNTAAVNDALETNEIDHAVYTFVQNQMSVISEQVLMLPQMSWFRDAIDKAEEEYRPSGPPMSPLSPSYFFCWSTFDMCKGASRETLGSVSTAIYESLNPDPDMLRIQRIFHGSRMGLHEHMGRRGDTIKFRELFIQREFTARCPAGYKGRKGEVWFARILPPHDFAGKDPHVVFGTPYVMCETSAVKWEACIANEIQRTRTFGRCTDYQSYMKYGPGFLYWPEYVFEAYVDHTSEVIRLEGLPNQPQSRPHSSEYK